MYSTLRITHLFTSVILLIGFNGLSQFVELSQSLEIVHQHISPTLIGGGVAAIDVNNDGWPDVHALSGYYSAPREVAVKVDL